MTAYYVMWAIICLGIVGICGFGLRRGYSWIKVYVDERTFLAEAKKKYNAVQKWREESGSKERFKDKYLYEEYWAQLPENHPLRLQRKRMTEQGVIEMADPDPAFVQMHRDGWYYPPLFR